MRKNKKITTGLILFFFGTALYISGQSEILSPVPGTWANKQSLVINLTDGDEAFYTFSGTDPMESGLAYDGPVTIDQTGEVNMRIALVSSSGVASETRINYIVQNPSEELNDDESNFVSALTVNPVYEYHAGKNIDIPSDFLYCFASDRIPDIRGRSVSVSSDCFLEKFFPFKFTDGKSSWYTVLHTSNASTGLLSKNDAPFEITDWTKISFTDKKFIYSIDDGTWFSARDEISIDRTQAHKLRWQSVAYQAGNPVQEFNLPPKPSFTTDLQPDGSVSVSLTGDPSYMATLIADSGSAVGSDGSFKNFIIDTFYGDEINGTVKLSVYANGIYQGFFSIPYSIDRKPPAVPELAADVEDSFTKNPVKLVLSDDEEDAGIYYKIEKKQLSHGEEIPDSITDCSSDGEGNGTSEDYQLYNIPFILLESVPDGPTSFKVSAYATDTAGNKSENSCYSVTVDEYNYYIDARNSSQDADGSEKHPFKDFSDCIPIINARRFTRIHLNGSTQFPEKETILSANCEITGTNNAAIVMSPSSFVTLRSASLSLKDCLVHRDYKENASYSVKLFVLEHAVADIDNCEIVSSFNDNGIVFDAFSSVINLKNTGITAQSSLYASGISATNSTVTVSASRVSTVAPTTVNFSIQGGSFSLDTTECRLSGRIGRVAELYGASASLFGANCFVQLQKLDKDNLIWADEDTTFRKNENTTIKEF